MDEAAIRITPATGRVLKALLDDPSADRYGFELMQLTGMSSGSLYPALAKLERTGWVTRHREEIDAHDAGRPARYYYRLTADGIGVGSRALAEFGQQFRPSRGSDRWRQGWEPGRGSVFECTTPGCGSVQYRC